MVKTARYHEILRTLRRTNDRFRSENSYAFVRHINNDTLDNRAVNLAWVTLNETLRNPQWTVDLICYLSENDVHYLRTGSSLPQ